MKQQAGWFDIFFNKWKVILSSWPNLTDQGKNEILKNSHIRTFSHFIQSPSYKKVQSL